MCLRQRTATVPEVISNRQCPHSLQYTLASLRQQHGPPNRSAHRRHTPSSNCVRAWRAQALKQGQPEAERQVWTVRTRCQQALTTIPPCPTLTGCWRMGCTSSRRTRRADPRGLAGKAEQGWPLHVQPPPWCCHVHHVSSDNLLLLTLVNAIMFWL